MKPPNNSMLRRELLRLAGVSALSLSVAPSALAGPSGMRKRAIPKSGEKIAIMGMGTSRTFDESINEAVVKRLTRVLRVFFIQRGQLIDTSPMYGNAERMLGKTLPRVSDKHGLFVATKVWTDGKQAGREQMGRSAERIGVDALDLVQIHNLRDWRTHLPTLRAMKERGEIRYLGVTTSHGRHRDELKQLLRTEPFDFVQFSYNLANRDAEGDLLPLAKDKGIATLINRPFQRGALFRAVKGKSLPEWAAEFDCDSWAQFFLKFVAAHPAVTCLIPATSDAAHMADNMRAGYGRLPDEAMRRKMVQHLANL